MSYVVMKRLGDHVTLVSERVFASRQQALEELGTALAGPTEDVDTEYVVFDLDAASPVLLLPVEVEESLDIETSEAALVEEIVFDDGPSFVSGSEELVLVGPAENVLVEFVTTEPLADAYIEDVVPPEEFADELIIEDIIIEDFVTEEAVEEDLAEEPAPLEADEKLAAKEQAEEPLEEPAEEPAPAVEEEPVAPEAAAAEAEPAEPAAEEAFQEPTEVEPVVADAEQPTDEEASLPDASKVDLALDELLPIVELSASPGAEDLAEAAEEAPAPEPEAGLEFEPEVTPEPEPDSMLQLEPEPEPEPVAEAAPEPEMPGYEAGDSDLRSLTCEDCVYVTTCPNKEERTPSACGSFQWVSV